MEFLHRLPDLRVLVTVTLLWLPNVLKVYSRNINQQDHGSHLADDAKSHDAYATVDHYISERLRELFSDQEKKDASNSAINIYNRNSFSMNDAKHNELSDTSDMSRGRFDGFINGVDSARLKLQNDKLHAKTSVIKVNTKYSKLYNDSRGIVTETNTNLVNDRKFSAEHTFNNLKETVTNSTEASNTMNIKSKRGLSPDTCETETIVLDLEFREHISAETSPHLLICKGRVTVRKCEGLCNSSVSPSVNHYDGFQRVGI